MSDLTSILKRVSEAGEQHARKHNTIIGYGTAGFRTKEGLLDHIMFRMGIVAALRSKVTEATIGIMITASHNPEGDNGLKLVDPNGEMLAATWETYAAEIANQPDTNLCKSIQHLIEKEKIDLSINSSVFVGRDTRQSGIDFKAAVENGFNCIDGNLFDYGVVTTPLLHFMVVCANCPYQFEEATSSYYYQRLSGAFCRIMRLAGDIRSYVPSVIFDGANGVGGYAVVEFSKHIPKDILDIRIFNSSADGKLNEKCGADFVKVEKCGSDNLPVEPHTRFVSVDGDADRIIYYYYEPSDKEMTFRMLDGDKIAVLYAQHLSDLLKQSGLNELQLGLVQTAYANGNSTNYINNILGIPVSFTLTGVKHLHHEASQKYDIGIYFEANGHGTVVFSDKAISLITKAGRDELNTAAVELANFMQLINPYVGDALSDMLVVEAILRSKGWSIEDWDSMYKDLPNRLSKVIVRDRNMVETTDAERAVVSPAGLQDAINIIVERFKNGRSFIRPSGTEDVVRVYAEADTQANADLLSTEVSKAVFLFCSNEDKVEDSKAVLSK